MTLQPTSGLLVFVPQITPRVIYTFEFIFRNILGIQVDLCTHPEEFVPVNSPKINYSNENSLGGIFINAHSLLFSSNLVPQPIETVEFEHTKYFFPAAGNSLLPFDPFAMTFYLVTRYEEYLNEHTDDHNRFTDAENILVKLGIHQTPVIDRMAYRIAEIIKSVYPSFNPRKRSFKLLTTIDIDSAWAYKNKKWGVTLGGAAKNALQGNWSSLLERASVLIGLKNDPFDTFAYILHLCEGRFDKLLFFFLLADRNQFDKNIPFNNNDFRKLIREIASFCEVGIHPSYMSNDKLWMFETEKKRLEAIIGRKVTKSRQHYLKLKFPQTYRTEIKEGITDDYTMGFAGLAGFRAGTCTPFHFFDLGCNQQTPLVVHPFQVMDVALKNYMDLQPGQAIELIENLMVEVKSVDGTFVSLFHNESLGEWNDWNGWRGVFEHMLEKGKKLENEPS